MTYEKAYEKLKKAKVEAIENRTKPKIGFKELNKALIALQIVMEKSIKH